MKINFLCFQDESDSIEKLHINAREAFSKFRTKTVGDTKVDFSDSISRKSRTGYKLVFNLNTFVSRLLYEYII